MFPVSLGTWSGYCLVSGITAALLMNIPMYVQPSGYQPAYIAAAGVTGDEPRNVSTALAIGLHHVTGALVALLYGVAVLFFSLGLPRVLSLYPVPAVPHLFSVAVVILFLYHFFQRVAVPRVQIDAETKPVVEQWALSAFIYGVTLALVVPVVVQF